MKCEACGKNPVDDGVVLIRQNEKGVKGVWMCHKCLNLEKPTLTETIDRVYIKKGERK